MQIWLCYLKYPFGFPSPPWYRLSISTWSLWLSWWALHPALRHSYIYGPFRLYGRPHYCALMPLESTHIICSCHIYFVMIYCPSYPIKCKSQEINNSVFFFLIDSRERGREGEGKTSSVHAPHRGLNQQTSHLPQQGIQPTEPHWPEQLCIFFLITVS